MISQGLNEKILKLAPKFEARQHAPDTFEKLVRNSTTGLIVWDGASELTIYGDSRVNFAMRAWHDSLHLKLNAGFDLEGETRVAIEQARLIGSDVMGDIIIAEVIGQVEFFNKNGFFPENQIEFILNYMKGMKK